MPVLLLTLHQHFSPRLCKIPSGTTSSHSDRLLKSSLPLPGNFYPLPRAAGPPPQPPPDSQTFLHSRFCSLHEALTPQASPTELNTISLYHQAPAPTPQLTAAGHPSQTPQRLTSPHFSLRPSIRRSPKASTTRPQARKSILSTKQRTRTSTNITNSTRLPPSTKMCRYYAHSHVCGHTNTVFAAYCPPAALKQRPCANGGEIWQTLKMDQVCGVCNLNGDSEAITNARKAKAAAAAGRC